MCLPCSSCPLLKVESIQEWRLQVEEALEGGALDGQTIAKLTTGIANAATLMELHTLDGHAFDVFARFLSLDTQTFFNDWSQELDDAARVYMASPMVKMVKSSVLRDRIETLFTPVLGAAWKSSHSQDYVDQSVQVILRQLRDAVPECTTPEGVVRNAHIRKFFVYMGVWLANLPAKLWGRYPVK